MSSSIPSQANFGSFVPTTNIWDIQQLQQLNIDPQLKELLVRLYQNINTISLSLNTRDAGYYVEQEFLNGQVFFPNPSLSSTTPQAPTMRQVFRKVINFGALPNATTATVAHGIEIQDFYSFTRIYGTASDTTAMTYIPIPYSSAGAVISNIEISVDQNDVTISTSDDYSSYNVCYVILEYIKQ